MEKRYSNNPWMWAGSILIALLVLGSLGFGAYRLYVMGWTHGAASVKEGTPVETMQIPPVQMYPYRSHRVGGASFLVLLFAFIVFGALFRHSAWRMHPARHYWAYDPAKWGWRPPQSRSDPKCDQEYKTEDTKVGE
jgi:hypothetical protein